MRAAQLHLHVEPGEPLTGTVEVDGRPAVQPFHGWIELMAIVNAARAIVDDH